jgi:molecular chaperone GrpE
MSDHKPKIEIDPSLMDEALEAVEDPKAAKDAEPLPEFKREESKSEPTADEFKDRWIRTTADFDNFRKRVQKEKTDLLKYGNETLIKEMLPVLDNFDRALTHVPQGVDPSFIQGIQLIYSQLIGALERFGLTSETSKGKPFDPNVHEAMSHKEDPSSPPHTVLEEHQKMYFLNKKLIRPALVTVSKGKDEASHEAPTVELNYSNDESEG